MLDVCECRPFMAMSTWEIIISEDKPHSPLELLGKQHSRKCGICTNDRLQYLLLDSYIEHKTQSTCSHYIVPTCQVTPRLKSRQVLLGPPSKSLGSKVWGDIMVLNTYVTISSHPPRHIQGNYGSHRRGFPYYLTKVFPSRFALGIQPATLCYIIPTISSREFLLVLPLILLGTKSQVHPMAMNSLTFNAPDSSYFKHQVTAFDHIMQKGSSHSSRVLRIQHSHTCL